MLKILKIIWRKILFTNISFELAKAKRIGLIGINGLESTFLKVLTGIDSPDSGNISTANGLRVKYLSQNPF